MKLTLLGTGSVKSAPVYGCHCRACTLAREVLSYQRQPASALLYVNGKQLLIDAGRHDLAKVFYQQSPDAVLLTHYHMDHVQGLFPMRWGMSEQKIPVFSPNDSVGCDDLFKHPGIFDFQHRLKPFASFSLMGITVTPLPLVHSKLTLGYVFEYQQKRVAYLCDSGQLRQDVSEWLIQHPIDLMILDCDLPPMPNPPRNHNDLTGALAIATAIAPKRLVLTHISHNLDCYLMEHPNCLPDVVSLGRDGQQWSF